MMEKGFVLKDGNVKLLLFCSLSKFEKGLLKILRKRPSRKPKMAFRKALNKRPRPYKKRLMVYALLPIELAIPAGQGPFSQGRGVDWSTCCQTPQGVSIPIRGRSPHLTRPARNPLLGLINKKPSLLGRVPSKSSVFYLS